jgi:polyphenol oxidase
MTSVSPIGGLTLPDPFYVRGEQLAIDLPGGRVVFTTRRGGHSTGPYESLNLGRLTDDEPAAVRRNRDQLETDLGVQLGFVRQVHGADVHRLSAETAAPTGSAGVDGLRHGDGLITAEPGLAPAVLTADCLPIALVGDRSVAMLHGGWRGLAAGIVAAGVRALEEIDPGATFSAAIGPGARPCCYEVGAEVHAAFGDQPEAVHVGSNLDLPAIARDELERAGVHAVHDVGLCTMCSEDSLFFSHRRDRGITGRQAGIAWLS